MTTSSAPYYAKSRARRIRSALLHLQGGGSRQPKPPKVSRHPTAGAGSGGDGISEHLRRLELDGVTIIEDVYSPAQISELRGSLTTACREVYAALPTLQWSTMRYQREWLRLPSFCVGKQLYEGKQSAGYRGTEIINLGRRGGSQRYDFYGGVMKSGVLESAWKAPALTALAEAVLNGGWQAVGPGALPTTATAADIGAETDQGGMWHRDAYPLFEDEECDLKLPQYELTCLIPMSTILPGEGSTEFVLGSHRVNLGALGLTTTESVADWAQTQPRLEATMKVGSVCVFGGHTLHRGAPVTVLSADADGTHSRTRELLYIGFKKNWYQSEPDVNFLSGSSHPGRIV